MKNLYSKRYILIYLVVSLIFTLTACTNHPVSESSQEKKLDVVLWNTDGDRFPAASGVELINYAAKEFTSQTGIHVNLILIDASTPQAYFEKRDDYLLSEDQPEILLFNTRYQDELHVIDSMKNKFIPLETYIDNTEDILDGMKGENYSAIAILAYGNVLNNALISEFGHKQDSVFMMAEEVEMLYLKWAETERAELNLFDYNTLVGVGLAEMICFEEDQVRLDKEKLVEKIHWNKKYVLTLPERDLSYEDVMTFYAGENMELFSSERDALLSTAHLRPVNFLTNNAFNAFDMLELSKNVNTKDSGFVMGDYSLVTSIGLGLLDNQSNEQSHAKAFANFLLSPDFQKNLSSYSIASPKMSGSVLKSVNEEQIDLASKEELLYNNKPIEESVINAHKQMIDRFNQTGALHFISNSSISIAASDQLYKLSTAYIWGEAMSDTELVNELKKLEESLNLMFNE